MRTRGTKKYNTAVCKLLVIVEWKCFCLWLVFNKLIMAFISDGQVRTNKITVIREKRRQI